MTLNHQLGFDMDIYRYIDVRGIVKIDGITLQHCEILSIVNQLM